MNQALYNTCKCCEYKWIFLTNKFSFTNTYSILKIYCTEEYNLLNTHNLGIFSCQPLSRLRIYSLLIKQMPSEQFSCQSSSTYEIHFTVFAVLAALGIKGSPNVTQHLSSVPHNALWNKQQSGQIKNRGVATNLWQHSELAREAVIEMLSSSAELQLLLSLCLIGFFV